MDEIPCNSRCDKTDAIVQDAIPDPHKGVAERSFTTVFEPSGDGNTVDEGEYQEDCDDLEHGIDELGKDLFKVGTQVKVKSFSTSA
jgi:hypothetical protein